MAVTIPFDAIYPDRRDSGLTAGWTPAVSSAGVPSDTRTIAKAPGVVKHDAGNMRDLPVSGPWLLDSAEGAE